MSIVINFVNGDICIRGLRHRHCHVCTGDRNYPTLDHVVSGCHRLDFIFLDKSPIPIMFLLSW
ncbi:hypothetical protein [Nostoc sp.]|uniref:hypothetical protein n=1 Tax=Nostoc sp. TaxID=1180 RepID=UPI002FF4D56B